MSDNHVEAHAANTELPPVITIDGPSGAGKGTVAEMLATTLGYHLLDSGAVYRAAAIVVLQKGIDVNSEQEVVSALQHFNAVFTPDATQGLKVELAGEDVTQALRTQETAELASKIAVLGAVRAKLLEEQRRFRLMPGLVADGRDMGTVVFPDAKLKVFLTASLQERASRRAKQLKEKGIPTTMTAVIKEIERRDERDSGRRHAPMAVAKDALQIDSSALSAGKVVEKILATLRGIN